MHVNFTKILFVSVISLFVSVQTTCAYLTKEEDQKYLETCSFPQNDPAYENIENFLKDKDVQAFFVKRKKGGILPWGGARKLLLEHEHIQNMQKDAQNDWKEKKELWPKIKKNYDLEDLGAKNHTFVLRSKKLWPKYVVKIARYYWFDSFELDKDTKNPKHSLYQNVSRVFYAHELETFVKEKKLRHIYPLKKYLFHIPGQPSDLIDDNYVVISEYMDKLPTIEENSKIFKFIGGKRFETADEWGIEPYGIKEEYMDVVAELTYAIEWLGLWEVNPTGAFYTEKDGCPKIVFVDLEKAGLGGGPDSAVFYKDDTVRYKNGTHCGLGDFVEKCLGFKRNPKILVDKKWKITAKPGKEKEAKQQQEKDSSEISAHILENLNILNIYQDVEDPEDNNKIHDCAYYSFGRDIEKGNYLWKKK